MTKKIAAAVLAGNARQCRIGAPLNARALPPARLRTRIESLPLAARQRAIE